MSLKYKLTGLKKAVWIMPWVLCWGGVEDAGALLTVVRSKDLTQANKEWRSALDSYRASETEANRWSVSYHYGTLNFKTDLSDSEREKIKALNKKFYEAGNNQEKLFREAMWFKRRSQPHLDYKQTPEEYLAAYKKYLAANKEYLAVHRELRSFSEELSSRSVWHQQLVRRFPKWNQLRVNVRQAEVQLHNAEQALQSALLADDGVSPKLKSALKSARKAQEEAEKNHSQAQSQYIDLIYETEYNQIREEIMGPEWTKQKNIAFLKSTRAQQELQNKSRRLREIQSAGFLDKPNIKKLTKCSYMGKPSVITAKLDVCSNIKSKEICTASVKCSSKQNKYQGKAYCYAQAGGACPSAHSCVFESLLKLRAGSGGDFYIDSDSKFKPIPSKEAFNKNLNKDSDAECSYTTRPWVLTDNLLSCLKKPAKQKKGMCIGHVVCDNTSSYGLKYSGVVYCDTTNKGLCPNEVLPCLKDQSVTVKTAPAVQKDTPATAFADDKAKDSAGSVQ